MYDARGWVLQGTRYHACLSVGTKRGGSFIRILYSSSKELDMIQQQSYGGGGGGV